MLPPIQSVNRNITRKKKSESSSKQSNAGSKSSFFQILSSKVEENNNAEGISMQAEIGSVEASHNEALNSQISSLFDEYNQRENNLLDFPSTKTFEEYKANVKELLSLLLKNSFTIKVYKDAQKREYEVVRTVDNSLQNLYFEIARKSQKMDRSLSILGKIRGLLLDLKV